MHTRAHTHAHTRTHTHTHAHTRTFTHRSRIAVLVAHCTRSLGAEGILSYVMQVNRVGGARSGRRPVPVGPEGGEGEGRPTLVRLGGSSEVTADGPEPGHRPIRGRSRRSPGRLPTHAPTLPIPNVQVQSPLGAFDHIRHNMNRREEK